MIQHLDLKVKKRTILDTTVQIVMFSQELGRNDTSFTRKNS